MLSLHPVAGKKKSADICHAFAAGCPSNETGNVFFGVDASNVDVWRRDARLGVPYYYIDNAYFDSVRQEYFRVTKNRLQHDGYGLSSGARFESLGIEIKPWRRTGSHIVVCPQSDSFMENVVGYSGDWKALTVRALSECTNRPLRIREWSSNKGKLAASLADDLKDAHALVTWSSAAAITAILSGVPAVVQGDCAAAPVAACRLQDVECAPRPPRERWAAVLADNQFTLEEMRQGFAWQALQHA